jgi:hypothetical protein
VRAANEAHTERSPRTPEAFASTRDARAPQTQERVPLPACWVASPL